ncbi:MAG: methyltransferase domain-containing protein [Bacteroidetes bacterium]|nr:methyltransferase domain-containing protein [Bacteroidota bacterium]
MQQKQTYNGPAMNVLMAEALELFLEKGMPADRVIGELFKRHRIKQEARRADVAAMFTLLVRFWRPLSTAVQFSDYRSNAQVLQLLKAASLWKRIYADKPAESDDAALLDRLKKYLRVRKLRESVADWMDEQGVKELGETRWEDMLKALNRNATVYLRTNTLRTTPGKLQKQLADEGIETTSENDLPGALRLARYQNVFGTKAYEMGWFEVQDLSSQRVAVFAQAEPGMRVADVCAGNGGKTLHLAALLGNKGKLMAFDVSAAKLETLRKRVARAGADTVEIKQIAAGQPIKRQEPAFDRVLLDVPCSGTGVLRRNPDIRWNLHHDDLSRLQHTQQQLLENGSKLLKAGGKLIYATCSIWPSEGEEQVRTFLAKNTGWILEDEYRTDPVQENSDGFYMARLFFSGE